MIRNRKELLAVRRRVKLWQSEFLARYGIVNRYADYVMGIESPDMMSRIIVEMPSYDDPDTVNTMRSALAAAANPERISFAVCFQSDNMDMLNEILSFDRCRVRHYAKADAPGACRARYDCQDLITDEDFVMHVDAHMRFASGWDVFFIDQWRQCKYEKAVVSTRGKGLTTDMQALSFDDAAFVRNCSSVPLLLVPRRFDDDLCRIFVAAVWASDPADTVVPGAFMTAHAVFAPVSFDREVRFDPHMNFVGDEEPVTIRAWEKGFRFFYASMVCLYHKYDDSRHFEYGRGHVRQPVEDARFEALLGLRDDIDLGVYGLSDMTSLLEYELYAGVDFRARFITDDAFHGRFGVCTSAGLDGGCVPVLENRKELLVAQRNAKLWQSEFRARYGLVNRYAKYVASIESPDVSSRIVVEIPSYDDPDTVNTMKSILLTAVNPDRISFAVCFQSDNMAMLEEIRSFDRCYVKHYAKADAPGTCRARYDCQSVVADEDFVMHVDAHMRFAPGWDIFFIDQWHQCGHAKAVMSAPGRNLSPEMSDCSFDDPIFVHSASWCPVLLVPRRFSGDPCGLVVGPDWKTELAGNVLSGAFITGHFVFAPASFDREVPVDPYMNFTGDEEPTVIRGWEKGFRFFHPSMICMFHRHDIDRHNASYRVGVAADLQKRQNDRYEALLGLRNDVELGEYGLSDIASLRDYEHYVGICFKSMSITENAAKGLYGLGLHSVSSEADITLAESRNASKKVVVPEISVQFANMSFSELRVEMSFTDREKAARTLLARDMLRLPDAQFLHFVANIPSFDLSSRILVEIPAYCDPETVSTVMSAVLNAVNPERVHFAVCLQDDDIGKLEALQLIPNCRVKHFKKSEAPGLCAARYECHQLMSGEEFVLHVDSHMRFARYWDVALLFSWRQCRDERAIVTDYAARLMFDELKRPLDDDYFVTKVQMAGCVVAPYFFWDSSCDLRFHPLNWFYELRPKRGAFIGGHFVFGRSDIDVEVPSDPQMDFSADEDSMAARYWTHGFNLYHCSPRYVYHLYNRSTEYGKPVKSADLGSVRRNRQMRRMEMLFGVHDDVETNLFGFGLGVARSLSEYEAYAGIDFRKHLIRKFAAEGRFDCDRTSDDLEAYDWRAVFIKDKGYDPCRGVDVGIKVRPDILDDFNRFCIISGYAPEAALNDALRYFVDRQRRYGR